jgi:hypothetical protein
MDSATLFELPMESTVENLVKIPVGIPLEAPPELLTEIRADASLEASLEASLKIPPEVSSKIRLDIPLEIPTEAPPELHAPFAMRPLQIHEEEIPVDPTRRRLWLRLQILRRSRERRAQAALAAARQRRADTAAACATTDIEHHHTQQALDLERRAVLRSRVGRPMPRSEFEQIVIEYRRLDQRFAASANRVAASRQALAEAETEAAPCLEQYRNAMRASERIAEALRREPCDEN